MAETYQELLAGNKKWVEEINKNDPEFFSRLAKGQTPKHLWIGCSDSRVPANEVTHTQPGDIFVHRNIANLVIHTDTNLISVLYYAVKVLKVRHVIVCGHYGCGGVAAALGRKSFGIIDVWLRNIKDVYFKYKNEIDAIDNQNDKERRLVELNVIEGVRNLSKTTIIQDMWEEGEYPQLHGWVYDLNDGLIRELINYDKDSLDIDSIYRYIQPEPSI